MSSEKKVKRTRSIKSTLPGGGRRLCDTIILDQTLVESDICRHGHGNPPDLSVPFSAPRAISPEALAEETVLCPFMEEALEAEFSQDLAGENTIQVDIMSGSFEEAGPPKNETSLVMPESECKIEQMEQWSYLSWELPRFMGQFKNYMDNESRYCDKEEGVPVKANLIQTGDQIDMSSTFLVNLFFDEKSDQNQNYEGEVNLNLPEGASYLVRSSEVEQELMMTVTLKLVHASEEDQEHYMHFGVKVQTLDQVITSKVHFLNPIKIGGKFSVVLPLDKKELLKMDPQEALLVHIDCCVYRPPLEWGLTRSELKKMHTLMEEWKIAKMDDRLFVVNLAEKCKRIGLNGLVECLNNLYINT